MIEKAFALACDRAVLVLAKPENTLRISRKDKMVFRWNPQKYPLAAERLRQRARRYNEGVHRRGSTQNKVGRLSLYRTIPVEWMH